MAFTLNSRRIRIVGSRLAADVQAPNGSWNPYELDLNPYLENLYGKFDTRAPYGNFFGSSRNLRVNNQGFLIADLSNGSGGWSKASIDLNVFVGVSSGILVFRRLAPHTGIDTTATAVSLSGSVFSAFLMGSNGLMYNHQLDLNNHYANVNGHFRSNPGDRGFYATARNVRLGEAGQTFILKAELRVGNGWRTAEVNLAQDIVNSYSRLLFVGRYTPPPSFWHKFLEAFEGFPLVGFVIAGIYALMGNTEAARRAISLSANSTIVMAGATIGGLLGGPWGAAIGAALTTPIGIFVETSLSPTQQKATIERYIFETLRNTIAAGAVGGLKVWLNRLATRTITTMFSEINRGFGGHIAGGVIAGMGLVVSSSLKKILDAIHTGVIPPEWRAVDVMVAQMMAARTIQTFVLTPLQPLDEYKPPLDNYKALLPLDESEVLQRLHEADVLDESSLLDESKEEQSSQEVGEAN
ncbi:hypothetical protein C8Q79DRAFT_928282 [Trametes meyenii]|nr:hypothetical protein C8Q79DRAFT_928282 [Trametes meyenii]